MRAVRLHEYGGVDQLRFEDVPVPAQGSGEAQVRIAASAVNPIDWRMRNAAVQGRLPLGISRKSCSSSHAKMSQPPWSLVHGWSADRISHALQNQLLTTELFGNGFLCNVVTE